MTNLSNLHGRLLEYLIVEEILKINSSAKLTRRAFESQNRDFLKLEAIDRSLLQKLRLAAKSVSQGWLDPRFGISTRKSLEIDRLPDSNNHSDVTDIRLSLGLEILNLSIKHNHTALRHQRPRKTPVHCGYAQNSNEMRTFSREYRAITSQFTQQVRGYKLFRDLPESWVYDFLYSPVCDLVCEFININSEECAMKLFQYLVGAINYYKVIIRTQNEEIEIQEFGKTEYPKKVKASVSRQYIYLDFSNDWKIRMRLHTASSRIESSPSLKFDTGAISISVPTLLIPYD